MTSNPKITTHAPHSSQQRTTWRILILALAAFACVVCIVGVNTAAHSTASTTPAAQPSAQPSAQLSETASPSPVVFVGFGGLTWASISPQTTPNLYRFASESSVANLVDKTLGVTTCPNSGWLTLNTGQRTQETVSSEKQPCQAAPNILDSSVTTWPSVTANNSPEHNGYAPTFGALSTALQEAKVNTLAVGPGAAQALADSNGKLPFAYVPLEYSQGIASNAGAALESITAAAEFPSLTLVDLGTARNAEWKLGGEKGVQKSRISAAFGVPSLDMSDLDSQAAAIDEQFGQVLASIPPQTTVIAASLNEADSETARLQFFALRAAARADSAGSASAPTSSDSSASAGTSSRSGSATHTTSALAYTNSTRHPGLVQNTDLPVTLLSYVHAWNPDSFYAQAMVGSPIGFSADHTLKDASEMLKDVNQRAILTRSAVGAYLIGFGVLTLLFGIAVGAVYGIAKVAPRKPMILATIALWIASIPMCALLVNLVPWWRVTPGNSGTTAVWMFFALLTLAAAAASACALAVAHAWHAHNNANEGADQGIATRAAALIAIATAVVFIADASTGSTLHYISVLGAQQPQDGSRFYGFANTAHITVALACIFVATLAARYCATPSSAALAVVIIGATNLCANASSSIGADFGGTVGIVAGFGLLATFAIGGKVRPWHIVLAVVIGVVAAGAFAVIDWMRPEEDRTHVGNFIQSVLNGELGAVIARKAELFAAAGSPLVWALTIFPILGVIWFAHRAGKAFLAYTCPSYSRALFNGAMAGTLLTLISLSINDSGPLLPFLGAAYAIPLWIASSIPCVSGRTLSSEYEATTTTHP